MKNEFSKLFLDFFLIIFKSLQNEIYYLIVYKALICSFTETIKMKQYNALLFLNSNYHRSLYETKKHKTTFNVQKSQSV